MKKINSLDAFKEYLNSLFPDNEYKIEEGSIFTDSKTKMGILHSKCGNTIYMSTHDFRVGHSCPICSKIARDLKKKYQLGIKKNKRTKDEFIKEAIENNKNFEIFNLENITNGESFVRVKCNICGRESEQKIKYVITGCSCMSCSRKLSLEEFKNRLYNQYPTYYRIDYNNFNNGTIDIHCSRCGKTSTKSIYSASEIKTICHCVNEENFIKRAMTLYNGEFEYVSGYKTGKSNVIMRHKKCNKEIHIRASHFLYDGCRCTRCNPYKNEERMKLFLDSRNIEYIPQKTFDQCRYIQKLQFDLYIPSLNLLVEYDGEGHFRPVFASEEEFKIAKIRDKKKDEFARNNRINILRIPYWRQNDIENILSESIEKLTSDKSYEEIQSLLETYKNNTGFNIDDSYEDVLE